MNETLQQYLCKEKSSAKTVCKVLECDSSVLQVFLHELLLMRKISIASDQELYFLNAFMANLPDTRESAATSSIVVFDRGCFCRKVTVTQACESLLLVLFSETFLLELPSLDSLPEFILKAVFQQSLIREYFLEQIPASCLHNGLLQDKNLVHVMGYNFYLDQLVTKKRSCPSNDLDTPLRKTKKLSLSKKLKNEVDFWYKPDLLYELFPVRKPLQPITEKYAISDILLIRWMLAKMLFTQPQEISRIAALGHTLALIGEKIDRQTLGRENVVNFFMKPAAKKLQEIADLFCNFRRKIVSNAVFEEKIQDFETLASVVTKEINAQPGKSYNCYRTERIPIESLLLTLDESNHFFGEASKVRQFLIDKDRREISFFSIPHYNGLKQLRQELCEITKLYPCAWLRDYYVTYTGSYGIVARDDIVQGIRILAMTRAFFLSTTKWNTESVWRILIHNIVMLPPKTDLHDLSLFCLVQCMRRILSTHRKFVQNDAEIIRMYRMLPVLCNTIAKTPHISEQNIDPLLTIILDAGSDYAISLRSLGLIANEVVQPELYDTPQKCEKIRDKIWQVYKDRRRHSADGESLTIRWNDKDLNLPKLLRQTIATDQGFLTTQVISGIRPEKFNFSKYTKSYEQFLPIEFKEPMSFETFQQQWPSLSDPNSTYENYLLFNFYRQPKNTQPLLPAPLYVTQENIEEHVRSYRNEHFLAVTHRIFTGNSMGFLENFSNVYEMLNKETPYDLQLKFGPKKAFFSESLFLRDSLLKNDENVLACELFCEEICVESSIVEELGRTRNYTEIVCRMQELLEQKSFLDD